MADLILVIHAGATLFMTGLIWFVQVVHYPLIGLVGDAGYAEYQREHMRRTSLVVGPVMLIEAVTAAVLPVVLDGTGRMWATVGAGLLAVIWGSTFLVQVPLHARLSGGLDVATARRLVMTNWARTLLWSARAGLVVAIFASGLGA